MSRLVLTNATLALTNGLTVHVSHFPYADPGSETPDKFAPWRVVDDGSWLLCGHVHEAWRQKGRMINVGVDAWGGRPVSEAEILELIDAGAQDLAAKERTQPTSGTSVNPRTNHDNWSPPAV